MGVGIAADVPVGATATRVLDKVESVAEEDEVSFSRESKKSDGESDS